jgi:DNA processing protein
MPPADLLDLLALTLVPGLGPRLTQALLDHFGSAAAARRATAAQLQQVPHIGSKLGHDFADALRTADPQAEYDRATAAGVSLVPLASPDYPDRLKELPDAPHFVYVRGKVLPMDANAVAIVGSRKCTPYGLRTAGRLAADLGRAGITVVSGLALGIDGAAHRGALEAGGRTLAVLAGGLSAVYPPEHVGLADEVAARGALLTETPMTMGPQRGMFHARNRLISGLARAVVIIEANDRSGALITARHAAEQGREVFAVPANVDSPHSAGSLRLLRDGVRLIRHADDLLEDLSGLGARAAAQTPTNELFPTTAVSTPPVPPPSLDPAHQRVWDVLAEPKHADEITRLLGVSSGELSGLLLTMEMKKLIRRAPGNVYERR